MPAINFTMLTERVVSGEKKQTIRPARCTRVRICSKSCHARCPEFAYRINPGDTLWLYTDMRRKGRAKQLARGVCTAVEFRSYGELSQEDALRDGFSDGYQEDACSMLPCHAERESCESCRAIDKLRIFLRSHYRKAERMRFAVIQWKVA